MKRTVFLILLSLSLYCCEKDERQRIGQVGIEEVMIPDTVTIDGPVEIAVKASATNLCWSNLYVELKEKQQFEYSLQSFGTFTCYKEGCACPAAMRYRDTILNFQPPKKGRYFFHISETRNRVVVDTMIVN